MNSLDLQAELNRIKEKNVCQTCKYKKDYPCETCWNREEIEKNRRIKANK